MNRHLPGLCAVAAMLLFVLGVGAGCAVDDVGANGVAADKNICEAANQCPGDQICRRGYCTRPDVAPFDLGLTFIPSNASGYLPQRLDPFVVTPDEPIQVALEPGVLVRGALFFKNSAAPGPSGTIVLRRRHDDEGLFTQQVRVDRGRFETFVLPGTYSLSLSPDEPSLPGFVWGEETFTSDTNFRSQLPDPASALVVSGTLTFRPPGVVVDPLDTGVAVPSARVVAMAHDSALVSTVATTDEAGYFKIYVWPDTGRYALHVTSTRHNPLVPDVVIHDAFDTAERQIFASQSLGEYADLPMPVTLHLQPEAAPQDAPPIDWTRVIVMLRGRIGAGTLNLTVHPDSEGRVELLAINGQYDIEVIAPLDSALSRIVARVDLGTSDGLVSLRVPFKRRHSGQVRDHQGRPLENVKLRFEPVALAPHAGRGAQQVETRALTLTTDEGGHFDAWFEPIEYQLVATPLATSGQPRAFERIDIATLEPGAPIDVVLAEPTVVFGTIYGEAWEGVGNVTVQGFTTTPGGQRRIVAEGQTNARGEFRLVVPAVQ